MTEKEEKFDFKSIGKKVLDIESIAIAKLKDQLDDSFDIACQLCLDCTGKIIVMGIGKSGHIADKLAATLASTGTPSFFVHPGEASHGDLGMISKSDVVMALSNSGKTEEIVNLLPILKNMGIKIIAMTGDDNSTIATASDVHIDVGVEEEACPMNLSPTASTTAALAMGDAIAVALLEKRGFSVEDFAKSHPGGSIGKKLLLLVKDIMHTDKQIPIVFQDQNLAQGLMEMSEKTLGMTAVINETGELVGIFTDGDLRRTLEANVDIQTTLMREVMTQNCITVTPNFLAVKAVEIIQDNKITSLVVVEENKIIGALNIHDLFRAGVM
ncbi:MAG: KpsF/GutQ family sugar-phosphate isomerase [Gammaproteobacteria bacterium]|nr:KpsF/GutQ family sugar-phosphate isomerase [Gammaproteobacteria bacterium]